MCTFTYLIVIKLDIRPLFLNMCDKKGENEVKIFFDIHRGRKYFTFCANFVLGLFTGTKASLNIYTPSTAGITLLDPCSSL